MKKLVPGSFKGYSQPVRVVHEHQIQHLEGELLTFLESLGLRESQEKAAKDMFRSIFYGSLYNNSRRADGVLALQAEEKYIKDEQEALGNSLPR